MSRFDDRGDRDRGRFGGGDRFGGGGGGGFGGGGFGGGGGRGGGKFDSPGGRLRAVDWSRETLEPFEKNLYKVSEASQRADPRQVEAFR
jgi:hypothetical protein